MRTKYLFAIPFIAVILSVQCGKKETERKTDKTTLPTEKEFVKVEIPETNWEKSLTILPVVIETKNQETTSIAEIMSEQMSSALSKTQQLKIVSSADPKIKTDYTLKNKIEEKDGAVTITFNLTDTQTDSVVWSETFEEELESLMTVEEMASESAAKILGHEPLGKQKPSNQSKTIMENYLKARSHLTKENREEIDLAIDSFKKILREDSSFVSAYTGLAESYLKIFTSERHSNPVWLRLAQESSLKAVQIDSNLAEGHLNLGQVDLLRGDYKQAEIRFRKALDINSNLYEAWTGLANVLIHFGLYESCLKVYEKTQALNPTDAQIALSKSMILTGLGKYEQAESEISNAIQNHPDALYFHSFLALNKYYQDDYQAAVREIEQGLKSDAYQPFSHAVQGMIYTRQKKFDEALGEIELEVKPYAVNDASLATAVAAVYSQLGQKGQAIQWLEKAYDWGYREYPWLVGDPNFENIKNDGRYNNLLKKIRTGWKEKMLAYNEPAVL